MKKMYKKKSFLNVRAMFIMALVCFVAVPGFAENWTGTLRDGVTYTLTTTTGNKFRVSCPGDSNFNGNEYDAIGTNASSNNYLRCYHSRTSTIIFNNTSPILINHIEVQDEATLYLKKGISSNQPTLKRGGSIGTVNQHDGEVIYLRCKYNSSTDYPGNPTLHIEGFGDDPTDMSSRFIFDGGAVFSTPYDGRTALNSNVADGCLIYCFDGGGLQVENAIFQNVYHTGEAGFVSQNRSNAGSTTSTYKDVLFRGCHAQNGAVLLWRANSSQNAVMEDVEIWGCDNSKYDNGVETESTGGTLRSKGGTPASLTLINCKIHDCESSVGGAIVWLGQGAADNKLTIRDCDFYNNRAHGCPGDRPGMGGAIYTSARMDLQTGNNFYDNWAERGGAICVLNYDGGSAPFNGEGFTVTVNEDVRIYNNTATEYGGGVFCYIRCSPDCGFDPQGDTVTVHNQFTMLGGEICGNQAPKGAGAAIYDYAAKHVIAKRGGGSNPDELALSGTYMTTVRINGGKICNNICTSTADDTKGGGLFIGKILNQGLVDGTPLTFPESQYSATYAELGGAGSLKVIATEGLVAANEARNNSANGEGGGMYITNETVDYNGECYVTIDGDVQFFANKSDVAGGGVKIDGGDVLVRGGQIGCEKFSYTYDTYNNGTWTTQNLTNIDGANIVYAGNGGGFAVNGGDLNFARGSVGYNTAKRSGDTGYGGGFHISGGVVKIHGGSIEYNTAERNGGGFYVDASATSETYISSDTTTTLIQHNHANNNGGGAFVNKGLLRIEDATTGFVTNDANTDGGGIYLSGGEVVVNNAYFDDNSATNGGGIRAAGPVTITGNSLFTRNKATNNGGAVFVENALFLMQGGVVGGSTADANTAKNGGGFYVTGANGAVQLENGEISHNSASTSGGGFYVTGTTATTQLLGAVKLNNNIANTHGGGGYLSGGSILLNGTDIEVKDNQATNNNGGGFYLNQGDVTLKGGGVISGNSAGQSGGAIFTNAAGADVTIGEAGSSTGFTITENHATRYGGAIRSGGNITIYTGTLSKNYTAWQGGAVYVNGGTFTLNGGTIGGTTADGNYTTLEDARDGGGGIFINDGEAFLNGGSISGNYVADDANGGAIFMAGGECTISGGTLGGINASYANSATNGGAIYSEGGTITLQSSTKDGSISSIRYNTATESGGAIYSDGDEAVIYVYDGLIDHNSAVKGGAIYNEMGTVYFSDGEIKYNFASEVGGGMYIGQDGVLYLKGNATLDHNHVPAPTKVTPTEGGGVYLEGTLVVGDEGITNPADLGVITAKDNYRANTDDPDHYTPNSDTRNNVYLPDPVAHPDASTDHTGVITAIQDGISINSKVGFSVPGNHVPVIYCKRSDNPSAIDGSWTYLDEYTTGPSHDFQKVLFDDTEHYISVHYTNWPESFDPDHVYLFGFWPEAVQEEPDGFRLDSINSPEDLAWLITLVNGRVDMFDLPDLEPHDLAGETVTLTADIDMSEYGWVPIGISNPDDNESHPFSGTFDGNGHTITGVEILEYKTHYGYGLFGNIENGTVENVFMKDAEFYLGDDPNLIIGALSAELQNGATLSNSEASATINTLNSNIIIGGAVGRLGHNNAATLHSVCAMVEMEGGRMGGLVGVLESGNLYNSFANPKFTYMGDSKYFGALVGVNNGTVENCYARMQGDVPTNDNASDYFGWFAGQNTGNVNYCYSKVNGNYFADNTGSAVGYGYYADNTQVPYLYARRDNQVTVVSGANSFMPKNDDKQMLYVLNNWVNENSNNTTTYTSWGRPTTKIINNDLPILRMPATDGVACTGDGNDGEEEVFLNYRQINGLLTGADAFKLDTQAIWLYASNDAVESNAGSDAKLYIDENVSVIPVDRSAGIINAYVGITIANVAGANGANPTFGGSDEIDWHMFSTPLNRAPLGIDYNNDNNTYPFSYGHPDGMPYYLFYDESSASHGYFPSRRYGTDYPNTNTTLSGQNGNYYQEWDFYTYYEPEYHWINFKRNTNSHWHENATTVPIHYYPNGDLSSTEGNEPYLLRGRGYLVAFADTATYLQCHGELNTGAAITIPVTTLGCYSTGYNFLGNPYQACLDFDAFAQYNCTGDNKLWNSLNEASYIILDETSKKYVAYAYGSSENPFGAGRYIHPHQGFMLYNEFSSNAVATFLDESTADGVHMRVVNDTVHYRGAGRPSYPLVNLFATEANGNESMVTVELGRPDKGGAKLMSDLHVSKGQIWCRYDDADYALAFTQPGVTELPIRFKTYEDNEYTMTWSTHNGDFSYLHLIDNITGVDVDCLRENSYKFSSKTNDFASRFRLVFDYTGIEEPVVNESNETFAFMMGDELVINGEGSLQMFDMSGRQVVSQELHGVQNTVRLPKAAAGIYVLRLNSVEGTKIQKIVVNQ